MVVAVLVGRASSCRNWPAELSFGGKALPKLLESFQDRRKPSFIYMARAIRRMTTRHIRKLSKAVSCAHSNFHFIASPCRNWLAQFSHQEKMLLNFASLLIFVWLSRKLFLAFVATVTCRAYRWWIPPWPKSDRTRITSLNKTPAVWELWNAVKAGSIMTDIWKTNRQYSGTSCRIRLWSMCNNDNRKFEADTNLGMMRVWIRSLQSRCPTLI